MLAKLGVGNVKQSPPWDLPTSSFSPFSLLPALLLFPYPPLLAVISLSKGWPVNFLLFYFLFFKILFIYSWETQREEETQAEGEAGSMQGARCETWSWDSRITSWAEGRRSTAEPPKDPINFLLDVSWDLVHSLPHKYLLFIRGPFKAENPTRTQEMHLQSAILATVA